MKYLPIAVVLILALNSSASAQTEVPGQVELPLAIYNQLVETARDPKTLPRPAPASYALGSAKVDVTVGSQSPRPSAEVRVELSIDVLEDDWVLIPTLPAGTPMVSAKVNGSSVQLIATPEGLSWAAHQKGSYTMSLHYRLDAGALRSGTVAGAAGTPGGIDRPRRDTTGTGHDVAVIPSAGTRVSASGGSTRVAATIPTTRGVQLSWRLPAGEDHTLSRASYKGRLTGNAVTWTSSMIVELMSEETLTLPLLPSTVTLRDLAIDGRQAPILIEGNRFATLVKGRGRHTLTAAFEVPVMRQDGPPRIELEVPPVPVSRFELTLPGKKEVTVTPAGNVESRRRGAVTVATAHVPLSSKVAITWAEAVPDEIRTEVRSNVGLYHTVHAEEGVLYVRALADYDVTRGETNVLRFEVPSEVQVERVAASGAVADWRLGDGGGETREVTIFLDRQLQGRLVVETHYDVSIGTGEAGQITVPLMRSLDAQRQRGMVALLSGQDLALRPVSDNEADAGATRVGENQLPAFVRQSIELTVAHTYKYVETPPRLRVEAVAPERQQGRYDAEVDTLISLGEVTMKGSASVEVDVKSGRIMELELTLPDGVNLLALSGPSVRQHKVHLPADDTGDAQRIAVEFTQEMEGQFRLEVAYELILPAAEAELEVPTLGVPGAEVEQGVSLSKRFPPSRSDRRRSSS